MICILIQCYVYLVPICQILAHVQYIQGLFKIHKCVFIKARQV